MDKAFTLVVTGDTAALFHLSSNMLQSGALGALLWWISPVVQERSGTMVTCVV